MTYTIYEHPPTHKFALLALPNRFVEGDDLPVAASDPWFGTRAKAIAALPELLNRDEHEPEIGVDEAEQLAGGRDSH